MALKETAARLLRGATAALAVGAFWGLAEALITDRWGIRAVWRPRALWESAFDRAVFYVVVSWAFASLAAAAALIVKGRPGLRRSAPWRWAALAALAGAINLGWLYLGVSRAFVFPWLAVKIDVRDYAGFVTYWETFLVAAAAAAAGGGFLLRRLRQRLSLPARLGRGAGVLLAAALLAYHVGAPRLRPVPGGPDIVLIILDAWRADSFNEDVMPKLSAFAERRGVVYANARATAPWTLPSMGAIFTGEYPDVHRRRHNRRPQDRPPTVAQALYAAGYETHALVANRLLQRYEYVADGFADFSFREDLAVLRALHFYDTNWYGPAFRDLLKLHADSDSNRRLARWLDDLVSRRSRRPRFIWAHFMDPHAPYAPPAGYYDAADEKFMRDEQLQIKSRAPAYHRLYNGECRFMDDLLAPVLAKLAAQGRAVVIVTSDHGEEFWEHKTYGHGKSVYETLLRVPLIIAAPGEPPARVAAPVTTLDLGATILARAGVTPPPNMAGEPLAPSGPSRRAFFFAGSEFTQSPDYKPARQDCVFWEGRKLILRHDDMSAPGEFYDLRRDPGEQTPLAQGELAATLRAALIDWKRSLAQGPAAAEGTYLEDRRADLRALGYIR